MSHKVIIMKRFPRYDLKKNDTLGIKSHLSNYANMCCDQLWVKRGRPENISIVQLEGMDSSNYVHNVVYGGKSTGSYDGLHFRGEHSARHLTYRAVQAIKGVIKPKKNRSTGRDNTTSSRAQSGAGRKPANQRSAKPGTNQSQWANGHQSATGNQGVRYSDVVSNRNKFSIPTKNRFNVLGN